ncbi:MAG: tRNA 5-methoxyuridine(34)/uridine 5-oxyacetic acid(34) synthase CmoB [Cellvibrionaceae bacterium]
MINKFKDLEHFLNHSDLSAWGKQLPHILRENLDTQRHGDLIHWQKTLSQLPEISTKVMNCLNEVRFGATTDTSPELKQTLNHLLQELSPWRKGPFTIHDILIDTEWRSDWKWDRLLPHINSLNNKLVLDVGCGNGYHCWRMLGEGAERVIGIDPSPRFVTQFYTTKHFAPQSTNGTTLPIDVIPCTLDDFDELPAVFDAVFSMGVLYHRASPIEHIRQLKALVHPGGQIILETLIIPGEKNEVLVPEGRYAMMNNVWFLPSANTLLGWLKKIGLKNPRLVNINQTSQAEQRQTEWMQFYSLEQFLDPQDNSKTVEGHPAPLRGIFVAEV